jgi:hypothetical protein
MTLLNNWEVKVLLKLASYFPAYYILKIKESDKEEMKRYLISNLENCPRIAGIEPLYKPRVPISGSLAIISGKDMVDACTRV